MVFFSKNEFLSRLSSALFKPVLLSSSKRASEIIVAILKFGDARMKLIKIKLTCSFRALNTV